jgi:hypothetical protein
VSRRRLERRCPATPWPSLPAASTPARSAASAKRRTAVPGRGRSPRRAVFMPRRRATAAGGTPDAAANRGQDSQRRRFAARSAPPATRRTAPPSPGRDSRACRAAGPTATAGTRAVPRRGHRLAATFDPAAFRRQRNAPNCSAGPRCFVRVPAGRRCAARAAPPVTAEPLPRRGASELPRSERKSAAKSGRIA